MKKTVLITGGNSGIGLCAVQEFLSHGWKVIATVRSSEKKNSLETSCKGNKDLQVEICHLQEPDSIAQLFSKPLEFEVLINNAGMYAQTHLLSATAEDFDEMFQVNTMAPFLLSKHAIEVFRAKKINGLLLHVSSTLGSKPAPNTSLYSASKAALLSLSKSIAMEFAPDIRSICVNPGVVKTPIHEKVMGKENAEGFQAEISKMHPLGRIGTPQEVAGLLHRLCGEEFKWVTGTEIVIDGGISLTC